MSEREEVRAIADAAAASNAAAAATVAPSAAPSANDSHDSAAAATAEAALNADVLLAQAAHASMSEALMAAKASALRVCGACGRSGAVSRCSRCLAAYYCTQQCQAADWKRHKVTCVKVDKQAGAAASAAALHAPSNGGGAGHSHQHTAACGLGGTHSHGKVAIPPNSAAVSPPPSSSASTRSSVASSTASATHGGRDGSTLAGATHSHSHGGAGHGHSHGSSAGHSHAHSHSHAAPVQHHSHSCASSTCPHKAAARSHAALPPASAASLPAAPVTATQLASSSAASYASPPAASASTPSPPPAQIPPPVHSQTSYSPVPISNVSASSRHIYVPPCRPLMRPAFLSFPYASTPPLSCIHGFHTNLLFSPTDPVRILYADLGDVRHVMHSLIDLHAKMKVWRKKINSGGGDKKAAAAAAAPVGRKATADGLPLPPPPAPLPAGKNPNIGIEFHLNDPNPHILARSVLFLVSTYVSSASMNVQMSMQTAANFGIPVPSVPHAAAHHVSAPYTPSPAAAAALCLSSYRHWSPADHWCYLFFLYGNFQMPVQFVRRTTETLQLLVRLTGGRLLREDREHANEAAPTAANLDSSCFSQHPYTFFLHLPSIALALLLPIWRNWEDLCQRSLRNFALVEGMGLKSPFHLPPVDQPVFPPSDVAAAHPGETDVAAQLNHFYKHGCAAVNATTFPASKSREEIAAARAAHDAALEQAKQAAAATAAGADDSKDDGTSARGPAVPPSSSSGVAELYPPCTEEYGDVGSYLLNPTVFPCNFSSVHFSAAGSGGSATASGAAPSSPVVAANLLAEVSQKWCFAREPFSPLLPRLSPAPAASKEKEKGENASSTGTGLLGSVLDLMSKMSHALFWVVQFQQSIVTGIGPGSGGGVAPTKNGSTTVAPSSSSTPRLPYVRLYFYNHDTFFHLHTYDFHYDRLLLYHLGDYSGLQCVLLMARARIKNQESILECAMNFPSCQPVPGQAITPGSGGHGGGGGSGSAGSTVPDLHKFCLLSLNSNPKLIRNIFGLDMSIYTYPSPSGGGARASHVVRLSLCEYSLDVSAPAGHVSDGYRVINDWFMTAIQPILLHEEFQSMEGPQMELLRQSTPRSQCNLRTFCMLIGLMIKQGHLDQTASRHRLVTLFATLFAPKSPYQMDHLFTSLITHIGLLKSELLPLMYLLLSPTEDSSPPVLQHNSLFFKGLWQLELVSMKFESLLHAYHAQHAAHVAQQNATVSHSYVTGGASGTSKTKLAQQAKISSKSVLPEYDANCRLCALAGPNHLHHQQHGSPPGSATSAQGIVKEPLLSLLFVTAPHACPMPVSSFASSSGGGSAPPTPTNAGVTPPAPLVPGSVPADSPLAWVNHRDMSMLRWLRDCGRGAQLLDVVDVDWSSGMVTAWVNRTYVHYVRKCSAFAQVCLLDFEKLTVVAPPRSVVHLKTIRSVNIR